MSLDSAVKSFQICSGLAVYSKGGATPGNYFVLSSPKLDPISPMLGQVRASLATENSTPAVKTKVQFQISDDGLTWSSYTDLTPNVLGDGSTTGDWFTSHNAFRRYIRFGVLVDNQAGTLVEMTRVSVTVDLQVVA